MATKVRGITIELGADVSGIQSALKNVNTSLKSTTSQLNDVNKLLKLDPTNTELLAQKQKLLQSAVSETSEKMSILEKAMSDLESQMEDGGTEEQQKQLAALQREYISCKQSCGKFESELDQLGQSSDDAADGLEEVEEASEDAGDGFTVAKAAVADLVASGFEALIGTCKEAVSSLMNLAEETREYREDIGKLETAFESAGLSTELATETYKEFYSVLGEEDRSVEAVNHLAKFVTTEEDMAKWTDICAGVWGTFGDSLPIEGLTEAANETAKVGDLTGVLADALNWAGVNEDDFQASLDACNSESERASLITETLNGLYEDAADNYKKNNAAIIESRKATSDYTDATAELGEALEPLNTEITQLKTQLVKQFAPKIKELANKTVPVLTKAIKYLADNIETILKVVGMAAAAFVALKAALEVAKVAQAAFNVVMSANPIAAVIVACAALTAEIAILVNELNKSTSTLKIMSEAEQEEIDKSIEAAEAYRDQKQAAEELAETQASDVSYLQNTLLPELQNLVDANGNVKEGYEERASFILGELNEALGTEYQSLQDIVTANGQITTSVQEAINAKKAQILLEAYEESYATAVQNVAAAEEARTTAALSLVNAQAAVEEATAAETEAQDALNEAIESGNFIAQASAASVLQAKHNETEQAKQMLEEQTTAYNEANAAVQGYYNDISSYEAAQIAATAGNTSEALSYLEQMEAGYETMANEAEADKEAAATALREEVIQTETTLRLLEDDYAESESTMTDTQKEQAQARIDNARTQADNAKSAYAKVGDNMVQGIIDGAGNKSWILNKTMENIIEQAVQAAKNAAEIKSPSRLFKKLIGANITLGIAEGIESETSSVVKTINNQVNAIASAYGKNSVAKTLVGVDTNSAGTASSAAATNGTINSGTTFIQNNYSPKALSRLDLYRYGNNLAMLQGAY